MFFNIGQNGDPLNFLWPMQWRALIGQREDLFGQNTCSSLVENVSPHISGNISFIYMEQKWTPTNILLAIQWWAEIGQLKVWSGQNAGFSLVESL